MNLPDGERHNFARYPKNRVKIIDDCGYSSIFMDDIRRCRPPSSIGSYPLAQRPNRGIAASVCFARSPGPVDSPSGFRDLRPSPSPWLAGIYCPARVVGFRNTTPHHTAQFRVCGAAGARLSGQWSARTPMVYQTRIQSEVVEPTKTEREEATPSDSSSSMRSDPGCFGSCVSTAVRPVDISYE